MPGSDYYDHTTFPSQGAAGSSAAMRSELESVENGFGKLPGLSGNGDKIVAVNSGGTALEAITTTGTGSGVRATSPTLVTPTLGVATATSVNKVAITAPATAATLTLADGSTLVTAGAFSQTLTTTAATNVTLPTTGTLATRAGTETLTNKTISIANNTLTGVAASGNNSDITSLAILPGYQFGCQLTMPVASATMPVSAGKWQDSTGTQLMSIAAMTKTTDAWVAGTGNGGRLGAAAVANNTSYDWMLIYNPTTGVTELGFDLPGVVTYPAGFTKSRRIFSAQTNGAAQWTPVVQDGDQFMLVTPVLDGTTGTPGSAAFTLSLPSIPTGRRLKAIVCVSIIDTASTDAAYISDLSTADLAPSGVAAPGLTVRSYVANNTGIATVEVMTSTARSIRARVQTGAASCTIRFITLGWVDTRGRDA